MADLKKTQENPHEQLFDQIDDLSAVMVGVTSSGQHMQPMNAQVDRDGKRLWFFTSATTDLAKAAASGTDGRVCVVGEKHDYHACLDGTLRVNRDAGKIEAYWNPVVAAWFKEKTNPDMTLLEFAPRDAMIWASVRSAVLFGFEIARANIDENHEPDVGVTQHIRFAA